MFLDQRALPSWAEVAYPGIANYTNHDIAFQMDHPAAKTLWSSVLSRLMPALQKALNPSTSQPPGSGRSPAAAADDYMPLSYMVCNECGFDVVGGPFGLAAFRDWLRAPSQYNGSIGALNDMWGTKFASFEDINGFPSSAPEDTGRTIPPSSPEAAGRAQTESSSASASPSIRVPHQAAGYYDFARFMGERPADFFGWMLEEIRKYHPGARGHIKSQNHGSFGAGGASGGIDRELVARRLGIVGADTRSMPGKYSKLWAPFQETSWQSFDWRAPALGYTLMRGIGRIPQPQPQSLAQSGTIPSGPIAWQQLPALESELHAVSMSNARARNISARHMRAVLLLSHVSGISGHTAWFWDRTANGTVAKSGFLGEWSNTYSD